ncbi:MAG: hypothetical protein SGJ24_14880 [Chloroflexota bacterium]|nr:hypothetical protein [Chloroflexota bacterium]
MYEALLQRRDAKAQPHLQQYAPVWIVDQKIIAEDEAVQFNAVFQHPSYGWVSRRYRFDGFNDVLYHKGQTLLGEEQVLALEENEPYVRATVTDIPNAYGG